MVPCAVDTVVRGEFELERCAEPEDFGEVVLQQWQRVFALVTRFERDRDIARDLTQECFSKAWRGWRTFRRDASVQTWLSHIAINVVRNHAREQVRRYARELNEAAISRHSHDFATSPEKALVAKEQLDAIWKAARLTSPQQSTAFQLRFANDMTLVEIACVMGITEGAVKGHLFRAIRTIRAQVRIR
jgi:RNA polymerase sigma-70 factor (ECF subfamily)